MTKKTKSDKFLKLVGEHREKVKSPKFSGTLSDYLKLIEKNHPDMLGQNVCDIRTWYEAKQKLAHFLQTIRS